jgi:hypothetical protein
MSARTRYSQSHKVVVPIMSLCCNPSVGLAARVRGCKVASQERDPGVTLHTPESAKRVRE